MTHTIQSALCTGTRWFEIIHQRAVSDTRAFWHVNQRHGRSFLRSISPIIFFRAYAFHRRCSRPIANFDTRNEMFVGVVYLCFCINDDSIGIYRETRYKQRYIIKYSLNGEIATQPGIYSRGIYDGRSDRSNQRDSTLLRRNAAENRIKFELSIAWRDNTKLQIASRLCNEQVRLTVSTGIVDAGTRSAY